MIRFSDLKIINKVRNPNPERKNILWSDEDYPREYVINQLISLYEERKVNKMNVIILSSSHKLAGLSRC